MKFLIAGYGSIGRRHFHNLLSLGERDIIFYRTHKSTLEDDELKGYIIETELESALGHDPDAVIVSNPTACHLDIAIPAAKNGSHLLIEKPISHSLDRIGQLQRLVREHNVKVLVGFQFRYHPNLLKVKEWLENKVLGRPLSVRAHWGEYLPDWHPWEDYRDSYSARKDLGGGVILTLCHPIDYLRWLFGEITDLWSLVGSCSDLGIEVEDTAEIGLQFEDGVIGSLHLNYTQKPPRHTMEIVCTDGTIRWDYFQNVVKCFQMGDAESKNKWQITTTEKGFERNDLFLKEMEHFIDVIKNSISPVCNLEDGIRVLEIALRARD